MRLINIIGIIVIAGLFFGTTAIKAGQAGTPVELKMNEVDKKPLSVEEELKSIATEGVNKTVKTKPTVSHEFKPSTPSATKPDSGSYTFPDSPTDEHNTNVVKDVKNQVPAPIQPDGSKKIITEKRCVRNYFHKNTVLGNVGRNEYVTIFELVDKKPAQDVVIEFISIWVIMEDGTPIRPVVIESLNPVTRDYEDFMYPGLKFVGEQTSGGYTHYNWTVALHSRIKTRSLRMRYLNPGLDVGVPQQKATFRTVVHGYLIGSECP